MDCNGNHALTHSPNRLNFEDRLVSHQGQILRVYVQKFLIEILDNSWIFAHKRKSFVETWKFLHTTCAEIPNSDLL